MVCVDVLSVLADVLKSPFSLKNGLNVPSKQFFEFNQKIMLFLKKLFRDDKIICKNFERRLINFRVKFREKFDKI